MDAHDPNAVGKQGRWFKNEWRCPICGNHFQKLKDFKEHVTKHF